MSVNSIKIIDSIQSIQRHIVPNIQIWTSPYFDKKKYLHVFPLQVVKNKMQRKLKTGLLKKSLKMTSMNLLMQVQRKGMLIKQRNKLKGRNKSRKENQRKRVLIKRNKLKVREKSQKEKQRNRKCQKEKQRNRKS